MQPIAAFPEATLPYKDCAELFRSGRKLSGSYSLQTADVPEYKTRCEKGWTTIAARNQLSGEPVSYTILKFNCSIFWLMLTFHRSISPTKIWMDIKLVLEM